jgi:hypothetical protein
MTAAVLTLALVMPAQPPALDAQAQTAREKAIKFLKGKQKDGTWDSGWLPVLTDMEGGTTAFVTLALLEAGVPPDDPAVKAAVAYLVPIKPEKTYVVSLQTQVLARVDPKTHAAQLQKNADWLATKAARKNGRLEGWSYPMNTEGDGSNSHFAVAALHAAAEAGAKVDPKLWAEIRELYVRTRTDRGWSYHNSKLGDMAPSTTMTAAGLYCLTLAGKHQPKDKDADAAAEKGMAALLDRYEGEGKSVGYKWMLIGRLGRAMGTDTFKAGNKTIDWYREGVEKLAKGQNPDGSWPVAKHGIDAGPAYLTACGLYFLGPPKK